MARTNRRKVTRGRWEKEDHRELKAHSKARTPVVRISKQMKRTIGALRQQAFKLGIGLGHVREKLISDATSVESPPGDHGGRRSRRCCRQCYDIAALGNVLSP